MGILARFRSIWMVDFEFAVQPGDIPRPVCMVAREFFTGREISMWEDELYACKEPPFQIGAASLYVSYYASAEFGCHLVLGWALPVNVLDLFVEFRNLTNGTRTLAGNGLIGALTYFGLDGMTSLEKDSMRDLVLRGGPWNTRERSSILDYCRTDVIALNRLLPVMLPKIDFPRALLRGRYMRAVSHMEHSGIPVDVTSLDRLKSHWNEIQESLITEIDQDYQVFEGRTFKSDRWEHYLISRNIPWPRLESGKLDLKDGTFRDMARSYPEIAPIRELRYNLSQLKLSELAAGQSGRNRCLLSPFASKTGRNQPSNSKYIFGPSTWLRGLIKPGSGMGLAYVDWSQQEFAIGAVLSGDPSMMEAYQSGDPYLEFGKQAGIIPSDGTKETHGAERDRFKTCALGVLYGMGPSLLAQRVGCSDFEARDLLRLHRETYPRFWRWSDGVTAYAELHRKLWTVYGWQIQYNGVVNPRSARNFPSQANAAEMMRLACSIATEKGIRVCGPIHDALLVEFNLDEEEKVIKATQEAMKKASALVLSGFELRSDVSIVRYPDRYMDKRGERMWSTVWKIVYGLMDKNEDR